MEAQPEQTLNESFRAVIDDSRLDNPKTISGKTARIAYKCNYCHRLFNQKHKLYSHLASKTPCYEVRDLRWLKSQFEQGNIRSILDEFDKFTADIERKVGRITPSSTSEDINDLRLDIEALRRKFNKLKANVRIYYIDCSDKQKIKSYEDELVAYGQTIDKLIDRYRLLLIA